MMKKKKKKIYHAKEYRRHCDYLYDQQQIHIYIYSHLERHMKFFDFLVCSNFFLSSLLFIEQSKEDEQFCRWCDEI
jgi:hypothetical protein